MSVSCLTFITQINYILKIDTQYLNFQEFLLHVFDEMETVRVKGFPKQCARHTGVSFSLWLPLLRTHSNESKPLSKQTSSTDFTSCKTNIDPCIRTLCSFIHPSNNETHHSRRFKRILHEHNVCSPNMHFAVSRPQCYCFFWAYFDKSATKSSLNSRSISVDNT